MKTIKQIADEIGVSKTAVRKKIANLGLQTKLQTSGNQFAIGKREENAIKKAFSENESQTKNANLTGNLSQTDTLIEAVIDTLRQELKSKDDLLTAQQKTINELTSMLASTQEALQTAQALHAGTIQKQLTDGQKKQGFIDRLFGRKGAGE